MNWKYAKILIFYHKSICCFVIRNSSFHKEEALLADWEVFLKSLEVEREVERITQNKRKSWVSKYIDFHRLFKKFKNMFTIFGHKHESLDEFTESLINFYRRTNVLINFSNLNFIAIEQLLLVSLFLSYYLFLTNFI